MQLRARVNGRGQLQLPAAPPPVPAPAGRGNAGGARGGRGTGAGRGGRAPVPQPPLIQVPGAAPPIIPAPIPNPIPNPMPIPPLNQNPVPNPLMVLPIGFSTANVPYTEYHNPFNLDTPDPLVGIKDKQVVFTTNFTQFHNDLRAYFSRADYYNIFNVLTGEEQEPIQVQGETLQEYQRRKSIYEWRCLTMESALDQVLIHAVLDKDKKCPEATFIQAQTREHFFPKFRPFRHFSCFPISKPCQERHF